MNFDITNLKISVTSFDESESSIEEMVERISQDIKNNEQSIENKNQNILAITEENTKLEQTITEYNNQIEQIKQEVTNSGTKVEELKQERIAKNEKLVNTEKAVDTIKEFAGVHLRLELVRTLNGVEWYNDSASTTPTRGISALKSFNKEIVLIAGGADKNLDYTPIAKPIVEKVKSFDDMTNLSLELREKLKQNYTMCNFEILSKQESSDGTKKYLFDVLDGNAIETVLMSYHHGYSICVSSQVGCKMGCKFCASTGINFIRNLSSGEIVE